MIKFICTLAVILFSVCAPATAQPASAAPALPVVQIVLNRFGIFPAKITVSAGQIILALDNRLPAKDEVANRTQNSGGGGEPSAAVATLTTNTVNTRVAQAVALSPGVFVLNFANHPKYLVEITVVSQ